MHSDTRPEWAVYLEIPKPDHITDEHLGAILELWPGAIPALGDRLALQASLPARSPQEALARADERYRKLLVEIGVGPVGDVIYAEVMTTEEQDYRLEHPDEPELAGVQEVAALLGVSKQRVSELRNREGFPTPLSTLAAGPVWDARSLRRFLDSWPRTPGRPRKAAVGSP